MKKSPPKNAKYKITVRFESYSSSQETVVLGMLKATLFTI